MSEKRTLRNLLLPGRVLWVGNSWGGVRQAGGVPPEQRCLHHGLLNSTLSERCYSEVKQCLRLFFLPGWPEKNFVDVHLFRLLNRKQHHAGKCLRRQGKY